MTTFTATISDPDEDGFCYIEVSEEGSVEAFSTHVVRADQARQWADQELAILNDPRRDETCDHGLSAALCSGPNHY